MLDGQGEVVPAAAQIEVRVAPRVKLGGAPQRLAGSGLGGTLAGVVDEDDGEGVAALQLAQVRE